MNFALAIISILLILGARNLLVARISLRRLHEIHDKNLAAIHAGTYADAMLREYDQMPSYEAMLFDLTRWTYRQFFPGAS